jgi:hypothetical protein
MIPVHTELRVLTKITKDLFKYNTERYRTLVGEGHNFTNKNKRMHVIFIFATD